MFAFMFVDDNYGCDWGDINLNRVNIAGTFHIYPVIFCLGINAISVTPLIEM